MQNQHTIVRTVGINAMSYLDVTVAALTGAKINVEGN